jgi:hypothetical protein
MKKSYFFLYFPQLGMSGNGNLNGGSASGPLRTTLDIDRLFVQQIYVRTANNTPISTGYVLQADGKGGTFFGPAAIQADYFALSSLISAGTAQFSNTLSTNLASELNGIRISYTDLQGQVLSTFFSAKILQDAITQNVYSLSNSISNISTLSTFVQTTNLSFSTLSSYIHTLAVTYITNSVALSSNSTLNSYFLSTADFFSNNFSSLQGQSFVTFANYSTFQNQLYLSSFANISSQYRILLSSSSSNYSTLSTIVANQQANYNESLSTNMSSYITYFSSVLGEEINLLSTYQDSLTGTVSSLSTLFFSIATYSLSSGIVSLSNTVSSYAGSANDSLTGQLSTIQGTSIKSYSSTLSTTAGINDVLKSLSTSLQFTYSTLTIELSITQTRGINAQLYAQFYQLGLTQSSILANNTSSINYLSSVIGSNYCNTNSTFSSITNNNYSSLLGIGFSSITIANKQVALSTSYLLISTLSNTYSIIAAASNSQSTFLGTTLSNNYLIILSSTRGNFLNINDQSKSTISTLNGGISTFSTSVFSYISTFSNSISTLAVNLTSTVSNWTILTVSNQLVEEINGLSTNLGSAGTQEASPVISNISNSLLGIISTTFSSISSFTNTFARLSTANTFTSSITFQGPVIANQGVFTQYFKISNVISSYTYTYTGQTQTYKPNPFANQILVQLWGAGGASGTNTNGGGGSYVEGIVSIDPTQIYNINVGGGGAYSTISFNAFNGGGTGIPNYTGAGGGATNIYFNTTQYNLNYNLAIAGGGGGGGYISSFSDWKNYDISTGAIVFYNLNNSFASNQYAYLSTFSSYLTNTGLSVNYLFSSLSTYNILNFSTLSIMQYNLSSFSSIIFNKSTFSTNTNFDLSTNSTVLFNLSTQSSFSYNLSTFSTLVISPYLKYTFSTISSIYFNLSTFSTNNGTIFDFSSLSTVIFNPTYSTVTYVTTSSFISTNSAYLNSTTRLYLNSTIYLPCGSWGGAGGLNTGNKGINPFSTISSSDFTLTGIGGTQNVISPPFISNIITRTTNTPPVYSTIITQSTFITYIGDFVPELMGFSPYLFSALSIGLITYSNNSSNYTFVSTNVVQDSLFSNYYSTVQNGLPNYSSTLAFYYTVRDLYSLQNTYAPNSLPLKGLVRKTDYTTDKTPTAIYAADLSFTMSQLGSPFGLSVHLIPFPFEKPDAFLYSNAVNYISTVLSTIQNTPSITNPTGLQYFNRTGPLTSSYNGTFLTQGIYGNRLDRFIYQSISTLTKYDYNIYTPSTIVLPDMSLSTTGWELSSLIDTQNYVINTSSIISSIYKEIFFGDLYTDAPPSFAPFVTDAFFPAAALSTFNNLQSTGSLIVNFSTFGDPFTNYFETTTNIKSKRNLYNIFISSAGANGLTLYNSLPVNFSSVTQDPLFQDYTSFVTYNMASYASNYFNTQDYANQNFIINDVNFTIKTIADFPTVKLYLQTISTISYSSFVNTQTTTTSNIVFYGQMGARFQGGNSVSSIVNIFNGQIYTGIGGGGGGGGTIGGQAGGFTAGFVGGQILNPLNRFFIGGGGGGGGSSYLAPLNTIGNSFPGQSFYSGFPSHPTAQLYASGQGGINSNAFNNYLLNSTFGNITSDISLLNGKDGLAIITEYVDPMRITISNGDQNFTSLRIDSLTNEFVVNKLVISSAQIFNIGPTNPSSLYLDFANYQQFYLTLGDHTVSTFHIIPLSTISSPTMNFQTGSIYLNISTVSTNAKLDFSSFIIENSWYGNSPGILSTYSLNKTFLFEYSIFNSNIYLTSPRTW